MTMSNAIDATCQITIYITTLALGLRLKQGHGKVQVETATWESPSHSQKCEKVKE
jgi:hypothetical protein